MASPIGPPSSPPLSGSDFSPLKRRPEVHSRQRSNQSCPDSNPSERLQRASLIYKARRSSPLLSRDEFASSYKPQYIKPLTVKKTSPISRKPVQESPKKDKLSKTERPIVTSGSSRTVAHTKDTLSPQLLTLVSEEDNLRRNYTWSKLPKRNRSFPEPVKSRHFPILDQVVDDQEPFPFPAKPKNDYEKPKDSSVLSLFDLQPLTIIKTSPTQVTNTAVTSGKPDDKNELKTLPLDSTKNPRLHSLYNPDLFSTLNGVGPNTPATTKRKSSNLQKQVTIAITSPTPRKSPKKVLRISIPNTGVHTTPTKTIHHQPSASDTIIQTILSPPKSFIPISSKYIDALKTTASADQEIRQAQRLRRHASLARLRELTPSPGLYSSSTGTPTPPLKNWISDLCNASMPLPTPSTTTTKSESRARTDRAEQRDRFQDVDDVYAADEEGLGRKAKQTPAEELTVMIDDMLNDLTGKFHAITSEIMAKMDDMGRRIDNLEASLNHESDKADDDGEEGKAGSS